jgi:CHAT domain-containing protein
VAATVLVAFQQLWIARFRPGSSDPVAELARALGTTRFIEPRLTGGFQHGRYVVLRSADKPSGLDAYPPAVIAAVARVREKTEGDSSPQALGAQAVTFLVSGDVAKAVKALESATAQDPKNPRLLSDLAAAYLVRASRLDEPSDIPKALEAAEKAIEIQGAPTEAWFNRALALEELHLVDSAKKAWEDFLERDSTSAWADEARKRIEELPAAQQSTIEEDRVRARTALAEGSAAIDALADDEPAVLADYFLAELLPAWSDAYLTGQPNAAILRAQAEQVGDALFRTTGDALHRDAARALSASAHGASRDPPRAQAEGFKALHEAQRLYGLGEPSCEAFRGSQRLLERGGSPYAAWASERAIVGCFYPDHPKRALAELSPLERSAGQGSYRRVLARVHWMQGLLHSGLAEFAISLERYRRARDGFRALRDPERESQVISRLAQVLEIAGERRAAWREHLAGLALVSRVRGDQRLTTLWGITSACIHERLLRVALQVQTVEVEQARRLGVPALIAEALILRSGILDGLGAETRAVADFTEARVWIAKVSASPRTIHLGAVADAAEGRIFASAEPDRASNALKRAIEYYRRAVPALVPGLRLHLARAERTRGLEDSAEEELEQGIRLVEAQSSALRDATLQASYFEESEALFEEMIGLQLDTRRSPARALTFVERSRARQLGESLSAPVSMPRRPNGSDDARPSPFLNASSLQQKLPEGVALVYYASQSSRLLSWVVTSRELRHAERPLSSLELRRLAAGYEAALERHAPLSVVQERASRLYDELIRPLALASPVALVFIPDGPLHAVPFAALWNRQAGTYLVEEHPIAQAPSGAVFALASEKAAERRQEAPRLLAVGDPRLDRKTVDLPPLPGALKEAAEVAQLYEESEVLTGRAATPRAFLAGLRRTHVVHFAGHAAKGDTPGSGYLLLAPDTEAKNTGLLYGYEIRPSDAGRTRAVVLAACRSGAGSELQLEGTLSLARYFLAAGVPNVVASLWDVDDASSRRLFGSFHRNLLAEHDPVVALRKTQLSLLHGSDSYLAHPANWAGFVSIGGIDHTKLDTAVSGKGL